MKKVGDNKYQLTGDLTIRDVTKEIELVVVPGGIIVDNYGNTKAGFSITGKINRFDYNLKWNSLLEAGGAAVGSEVRMIFNVHLVQDPV